jgi:hypothetical protein
MIFQGSQLTAMRVTQELFKISLYTHTSSFLILIPMTSVPLIVGSHVHLCIILEVAASHSLRILVHSKTLES